VAERVTTIAVSRFSVTDPDFVLSAIDEAVTVTVTGLAGAVLGAVNRAASPLPVACGVTDPHGGVGQLTLHITPLFEESFVTCAVTLTVAPAGKLVVPGGNTVTEIGGPLLHPDRMNRNDKLRSAKETETRCVIGPPNTKSAQVRIRVPRAQLSPDFGRETGTVYVAIESKTQGQRDEQIGFCTPPMPA